jgi:hypothetical protein
MLALPHFANPAWITMRCLASPVPLGRTSRVGVLRRLNDKPNSMAAQLRDAAIEQQECSTGYYSAKFGPPAESRYSFFGSSSSSITRLSNRPAPPPSILR